MFSAPMNWSRHIRISSTSDRSCCRHSTDHNPEPELSPLAQRVSFIQPPRVAQQRCALGHLIGSTQPCWLKRCIATSKTGCHGRCVSGWKRCWTSTPVNRFNRCCLDSRTLEDAQGRHGSAIAVVDVHDAESRSAAGEHAIECSPASGADPIAHRHRYTNNRLRNQTG